MTRIVIANLAFVLMIVSCQGTPVAVTAVPTTTPTSISPAASQTPASTAEPTSTSELDSPVLSLPAANCCKARTVEAAEYELPAWLGLPLTIELVEGWEVLNKERARLFLLAGGGRNGFNDPSQVLVLIVIPDEDPQAILTSIQDSPDLTSVGEITETMIAGLSGWHFDAAAKPNPENEGSREESIPPGAQPLPAIGKYFAPGFAGGIHREPDLVCVAGTYVDA